MTAKILDEIIRESEQKVKSLPDVSFTKERILDGIRCLEKAREKLSNPNSDRKEIDRLIVHGLTLIYHEQQH